MNIIVRLLLACLLLSWFPVGATKAQEVEFGQGLICDTKEQVAEYVKVYEGDNDAALVKVNGATNPPACGIVLVAYYKSDAVERVRASHGTYDIVPILVLAVNFGSGWIRATPLPQFTLMKVEERGA